MIILMLVFLILFQSVLNSSINDSCPLKITEKDAEIKDFDDLDQINLLNCNSTVNTTFIEIRPSKRIILKNFNASGLIINAYTSYLSIQFSNFKGIDLQTTPLKEIEIRPNHVNHDNTIWTFKESDFSFYLNESLIDDFLCNFTTFYEISNSKTYNLIYSKTFLNTIKILDIQYSTTISNKICPFVFEQAELKLLSFNRLSKSFVIKKTLAFYQSNMTIIAYVYQLTLNMYHYTLDESLLHTQIFKKLVCLDLNGQIKSIQEDLFKSFLNLKVVRISSQYIKQLLFATKWLEYLNYGAKTINLENRLEIERNAENLFILIVYQEFANFTYYDFPNEDICNFRSFPHQRLVFPKLKPIFKSSCSCTELFLIQYSYWFSESITFYTDQAIFNYGFMLPFYNDVINDPKFSKCTNKSFRNYLSECNFESRLNNCNIQSIPQTYSLDWYIFDWEIVGVIFSKFFAYVICIFSLFSIFFNVITILILSDKHLQKDLNNFYYYLLINSYSNVLFIVFLTLSLLSSCYSQSLFCFQYFYTAFSQYTRKIVFKLFKNSLKSFSNLTYMSFILIRFIRITSTKNILLNKFNKMKLKYFLSITIPICLFLNFYIYFEYNFISSKKEVRILQNGFIFQTDDFGNQYDDFKTNLTKSESFIFNFFQYLKIVVSDFFVFLFSIYFDLSLLLFIKRSRKHSAHHTKLKKSSQSRIRSMIILNGLNFVFLRFPSDLIEFYGLFFNYDSNNSYNDYRPNLVSYLVCRMFRFCEYLSEIFNLFYLSSFLIQFFIFYRLDKNFNASFKRKFPYFKNK